MKEKIIGVLTCFVLFIVIVTLFNMVQYNTILNISLSKDIKPLYERYDKSVIDEEKSKLKK